MAKVVCFLSCSFGKVARLVQRSPSNLVKFDLFCLLQVVGGLDIHKKMVVDVWLFCKEYHPTLLLSSPSLKICSRRPAMLSVYLNGSIFLCEATFSNMSLMKPTKCYWALILSITQCSTLKLKDSSMKRAYQCGEEREGVGFLIYFSSSFITRKYLYIHM